MKNPAVLLFLICIVVVTYQLGAIVRVDPGAAPLDEVYNAAACRLPSAPSWCSGPDIGGWINAAIAAGASEIYVPAGTYSQTTTIVLPRYARVRGAGAWKTTINFT